MRWGLAQLKGRYEMTDERTPVSDRQAVACIASVLIVAGVGWEAGVPLALIFAGALLIALAVTWRDMSDG